MIEKPTRRGFLLGLGAIVAAPAIVRASSIMPVKVIEAAGLETIFRNDYTTDFTLKQLMHVKAMLEHETIPPWNGKYVFYAHPRQVEIATRFFEGSLVEIEPIREILT